jgi:hypothetical protein
MNPYVSQYAFPTNDPSMPVELCRVGEIVDGEFNGAADVWAVRWLSRCWNRDGEWEFEPLPSSRDDAFKARTRFDFEHGWAAAFEASAHVRRQRGGSA